MNSEIKKRINTGLILFLILFLMFLSKIVYIFISMVIFVLSFIEFSKMTKRIFKNKIFKFLLINFVFLFYLFLFLLVFIISVNDIQLKIILFTILLICSASDIGGIIFGKTFKGPKLTKISPNKTLVGSLGSVILSAFISIILLKYLYHTSVTQSILLGIIISFSVQIGDLFFSYMKRKSSIKNTGNILPGHGGILDRIDGILLGLPIGLIFMLLLIFKI